MLNYFEIQSRFQVFHFLFKKWFVDHHQTLFTIAYLPQYDRVLLLLKTPYTYVIEHREFKLKVVKNVTSTD